MVGTGEDQLYVHTREIRPGIHEVRIEGTLDFSNAGRLESVLNGLFQKGICRLVVNLSGLKYVSSVGLGCLISSLDVATQNDGNIVFTETPPDIQSVFNLSGLAQVLRFAENEAKAVEQFTIV